MTRPKSRRHLLLCAIFGLLCVALVLAPAQADIIMPWVTVGNPGNAANIYGYGSVGYEYQIGKYEVTNIQWREFLTAKASVGDPYGLYNTSMASTYGGIARSGAGTGGDPYVYSAKGGDASWDNRPVNFVNFWDAARFANWLHNGQGSGDTESGAYINIGNQSTFARQPGATYFIPTEDEWCKAAYHKNDGVTGNYFEYPTGTDLVPSNDLIDPDPGNNANFDQSGYTLGSPYGTTEVGEFENSDSPYGTFDQGGNLWEWNETAIGSYRGQRGGLWNYQSLYLRAAARSSSHPAADDFSYSFGFRVASVPEPGSLIVLVGGLLMGLIWWRRRR